MSQRPFPTIPKKKLEKISNCFETVGHWLFRHAVEDKFTKKQPWTSRKYTISGNMNWKKTFLKMVLCLSTYRLLPTKIVVCSFQMFINVINERFRKSDFVTQLKVILSKSGHFAIRLDHTEEKIFESKKHPHPKFWLFHYVHLFLKS